MAKFITNLSVVLPAYNEEAVIAETVAGVLAYGRERGIDLEVLVVNDGSLDRTGAVAREIQRANSEIVLVTHEKNRGYGEALRSGFNAASKEWIFLMDADGQFDINELDAFVPFSEAYDMIIGYRAYRADPLHRVIFGWGFTLLMNALFGMRFKDIDCAFKLFRRSCWLSVQPIASTDHKIFTVEWLLRSKRARLRINQLPVRHLPRLKGSQTGARIDVIWQMAPSLLKLRFARTRSRSQHEKAP